MLARLSGLSRCEIQSPKAWIFRIGAFQIKNSILGTEFWSFYKVRWISLLRRQKIHGMGREIIPELL